MRITWLLLLAACINSSIAQSYFPPKTGAWETKTATSLGWCLNEIDSLYDFLDKGDTKAFIVLKDGKIVLEKYFDNFSQDSLWYWASAGKTLTAIAVGIAQKEGYLKLTDSSSKYLGMGWSSLTPEQEGKITVWHHLSMTTGLDDGVSDVDCTDKACLKYKSDPGTRWAYHNAPYTLLDKVIEGATGQNLNTYLTSRIKNQIGLDGAFIKIGYNNVYFSTARGMARFGLLLLNKGNWNAVDVLGDTSYFNEMTNTSQILNRSYGYLTWLNGKQSFMVPGLQIVFPGSLMADAPADMYSALGKNSQYINVVPSKGLVLVRMGNNPPQGGGLVPTTFDNNIWKYMSRIMCNNTGTVDAGVAVNADRISYPNPTKGILNFEWPETLKRIELYTSGGKLILQTDVYDAVSLKGLPKGMYFVKVGYENKRVIEKILLY